MAQAEVETPGGAGQGSPGLRGPALVGSALLIALGLAGRSDAAVGYALFAVATALFAAGVVLLGVLALTRRGDGAWLGRTTGAAFRLGGWTYVLAVAAMSGYYVHEAAAGRIGWTYVIFGPAILAAIVALDVGIWRVLVQRNMATVARFGDLWRRERLDQRALRRTLVDEVILHRSLWGVSRLRWLRHQLIFWGFAAMFAVELAAVFVREAFPAFGWTDVWHRLDHPVRLGFDLAYEVTGAMMLAGCLLALWFRWRVQGTPEQKYADTPTTVFLLLVVVTGFLAEGSRIALMGPEAARMAFLGSLFAPVAPQTQAGHDLLWVVHALLAAAFIAYVPARRLIHSCAVPIGRLANSQAGLMRAKKERVLRGLVRGGPPG